MKKVLGFALCLLGTAAMILWGILWSVEYVGTDSQLYRKLQFETRDDILEYAGLAEEDLVRINEALADCLQGDEDALAGLEAEVFGRLQPVFNERELVHMEDCAGLFKLARTVKQTAKIIGPVFLIIGFVLLKDRRRISLAVCLGPLGIVVPLASLAVWAVVDFNAAFNFFHEMLFTNDLWLLNPATDLLIRICPQSMFMNMGMRIGTMGLIFALAVPGVALVAAWLLAGAKLLYNGDER